MTDQETSDKMRKLSQIPRRKVTKICVICGDEFEAVRMYAQCCHKNPCRYQYFQLRKKKRLANEMMSNTAAIQTTQ